MHLQVISPFLHRGWLILSSAVLTGHPKSSLWTKITARCVCLVGLIAASVAAPSAVHAEFVSCDLTIDTSIYFCRGWQDDVGPNGKRVRFIARMMGDEEGDDFGHRIVSLGDINDDGRGDFMVSVREQCEWRIYLGDTLINKTPYLVWPKGDTTYGCGDRFPGNFASIPDISGDGEPDLFRLRPGLQRHFEIYHAGSAFDTIPDFIVNDTAFINIGANGHAVSGGLDINGDGQPDFIIGDPSYIQTSPKEYGRAYVYWAGDALDSIPDLVFTDTFWVGQDKPISVGGAVAVVPSLNGDQYANIVIGRNSINLADKDPLGRVDIFLGGPDADTVRDLLVLPPDTSYHPVVKNLRAALFGGIVKNVGDVNLDGLDDLLISGSSVVPGYIYWGGPDFDTTVDLGLTQPWPANYGIGDAAFRLGDVNGDGYADFGTVKEGDRSLGFRGIITIHYSVPDINGQGDWSIYGNDWFLSYGPFGQSTTSVGDIDGDGFDDIATGTWTSTVHEESEGAVYIFAGFDPDMNTAVFDDDTDGVPTTYHLIQSIVPNPFNSSTRIHLSEHIRTCKVAIYNILGQRIRQLHDGRMVESNELEWNGRDDSGNTLSSGIYFVRAITTNDSATKKIVLLK